MKLFRSLLIAAAGFALIPGALAQDAVTEVYVCKYRDGQGFDDLMAARDYYLEQAEKAGLETPRAFVWTPYKGFLDFDFLWFNNYKDLQAFAENADVEAESETVADILSRFNEVAACRSSISSMRTVFDGGEPPVTNPPAFLESYACNLRHGRSMTDLSDLWGHIRMVLGGLESHKAFYAFATTPITRGSNSHDVYITAVHDSAGAWAERTGELMNSAGGPALMRHFDAMLDCNHALYRGMRVVPPLD